MDASGTSPRHLLLILFDAEGEIAPGRTRVKKFNIVCNDVINYLILLLLIMKM